MEKENNQPGSSIPTKQEPIPGRKRPREQSNLENCFHAHTWDKHEEHLGNQLQDLFVREDFSDITLLVRKDSVIRAFQAHKLILASCSPYLDRKLREAKNSSKMLIDENPDVFSALLLFMYTGQLLYRSEKSSDLVRAARNLEISGLQSILGGSENKDTCLLCQESPSPPSSGQKLKCTKCADSNFQSEKALRWHLIDCKEVSRGKGVLMKKEAASDDECAREEDQSILEKGDVATSTVSKLQQVPCSSSSNLVPSWCCLQCQHTFTTSAQACLHQRHHSRIRCSLCRMVLEEEIQLRLHQTLCKKLPLDEDKGLEDEELGDRDPEDLVLKKEVDTDEEYDEEEDEYMDHFGSWDPSLSMIPELILEEGGSDALAEDEDHQEIGEEEVPLHLVLPEELLSMTKTRRGRPRLVDKDGLPAPILLKKDQQGGNNKKYLCSLCGRTLTGLTAYNRHQLIHTGARPFECDVCGKNFTQNQRLTVHRRIHTGERPFLCSLCGKTFTESCKLKRHLSRVHKANKDGSALYPGQPVINTCPKGVRKSQAAAKKGTMISAEVEKVVGAAGRPSCRKKKRAGCKTNRIVVTAPAAPTEATVRVKVEDDCTNSLISSTLATLVPPPPPTPSSGANPKFLVSTPPPTKQLLQISQIQQQRTFQYSL